MQNSATANPALSDPINVLTGMYAAEAEYLAAGGPGAASFDLLAPFFAPDVALYQADALPYGGIWRGHAGLERFFVTMSAVWETFEMAEQEFLASGDDMLVVRTEVHARARATGRELDLSILQTIKFDGDRIAEIYPFYWDTREIAEACRITG